jgi:hypothetical protein
MFAVRSNGAALAGLFGPTRRRHPARSYASLADELADNDELRSLPELMANALGIEVEVNLEHDMDVVADDIGDDADHAANAVLRVPEEYMQATKRLLAARGMTSRAWR